MICITSVDTDVESLSSRHKNPKAYLRAYFFVQVTAVQYLKTIFVLEHPL